MHFHGESYGTTTIGKKGQIVIPVEARKKFNLKEGDKLLVFGRFGRFVGLMKMEDFDTFIDKITSKMAKGIEKLKELKKYGKNHRSRKSH